MERADKGLAFLLRYENVAWYEDGKVRILDRRVYPMKTEHVTCSRYEEVAQAIADMVTQSAGPYTAAAMGMVLAAHQADKAGVRDVSGYLEKAAYTLSHARPTTVEQMKTIVDGAMDIVRKKTDAGIAGQSLTDALFDYAFHYIDNNYRKYTLIGRSLARLIPQGDTILTQCFADTVIGTLLRECREQNNPIRMICPETRPYFQGSRLTASVACDMGFDVTVISDNMPAFVIRQKHVGLFTSASDVITMDGHIVNKVGTFQIALAARYWGVPYYVTGTPDPSHPDMSTVTIEERDPAQVLEALGTRVTMPGVKGYYPAFDVTPPELCTGIVTDKGIFAPSKLADYLKQGND